MKREVEFNRGNEIENNFWWDTSMPLIPLGSQESECSTEMRSILFEFLPNECLLTAKNRDVLCCYWSLTEDCIENMAGQKPVDGQYYEAMRLTWPARSLFDLNYQIIPVSLTSCHEHLCAPHPGQIYQVEVGWICKDGRFISILTSNRSDTH